MSKTTIYVPFNDKELITGAERMANSTSRGEEGQCIVAGKWWQRAPLRNLKQDATLYILAHGRYGSAEQIAGKLPDGKYAYLNATQLASQLISDGLTKRFCDLRLLVCWGGYVGPDKGWGSHTLKRSEGHAPFAGYLCGALKAKGFNRIVVTGYTGAVLYPKATGFTPPTIHISTADGGVVDTQDTGRSLLDLLQDGRGTLSNANRTVWY